MTSNKTPEGLAISARNSLQHGCCSTETLLLKTENIEDFKAVESIWFRTYEPKAPAEVHLVKELVNADWFLQRTNKALAQAEAKLLEQTPDMTEWTEEQHRSLARFLRYQTTRANAVTRARKAVEDFRKCRAAEKQGEAKAVIAQERHEIYKEKNKPEPPIDQIIQQLVAQRKERERQEALAQQNQPTDQK